MSEWTVHLEFEEGTSSKFWRARVEGKTLYVNYGKIGSNGQTQVKDFGDPGAAKAEYDKLVRDKRKKGYQDPAAGGAGPGGAGDDEEAREGGDDASGDDADDDGPARPAKKAAAKPAATARPAAAARAADTPPASVPGHRLVLEAGTRKVAATLYLDGSTVRMDSSETYPSSEAAARAFERLKQMLGGEGYKPG
jgi:predicted DNA-binding WGR domain protein